MKFIDLNPLTEEERKKILEQQQNFINENNQENEARIQKTNDYFQKRENSLWNKVLNTSKNIGKIGENTWLGFTTGYQNIQQNLTEAMQKGMETKMNMPFNTIEKNIKDEKQKEFINSQKDFQQKEIDNIRKHTDFLINERQNKKMNYQNKILENTENIDNKLGKKISEVAPSVGQMAIGMIPGAGLPLFTSSVMRSYYDDAKQRGMNDSEAKVYSSIMGIAEGATEMVGIGKIKEAGKLAKSAILGKELTKEVGKKATKSTLKEAFKSYGIGIADNAIQEAIIDPIQEATAGLVGGKDKAEWNGIGQKMIQDAVNGGLVGAIMGGANLGLQSCTTVVEKIQNNETPTKEEFNNAVKEASTRLNTEQMIKDNVNQEIGKINANNNQQQITPQEEQNTVEMQPRENKAQENLIKLSSIIENDKYIPNEAKIDYINAINELSKRDNLENDIVNDISSQIKQLSNEYQTEANKIDTGKKYLTGRKEIYNEYMKKSDYDNSVVNQAKEVVRPNSQGRRTKEQWLQVAKQIGTNIADKSNKKIQEIAYKSWQEERPNTSATLNRQGKKYVKFDSDDWIDTIYNQVKEQREKTGYAPQNETITQLDNLTTEMETLQKEINKKPVEEAKQVIDTSNMNLIDSAKQYNLDTQSDTIKSIDNTLSQRGIKAKFDDKITGNGVWIAKEDGTREVVLNPNMDINKTVEFVATHELTHDLAGTKEFEELSKLILDKNQTREGHEQARANLEEIYSQVYDKNSEKFKNLVDEEEVADTLAQKLSDQEFLNTLNKKKPTIFDKVYEWVIEKLNKFTGGKVEKLYWENVRNKFEKAYKQDYIAKKDTKYSTTMEDLANLIEKRNTLEQRAEKLQKAGDETWIDVQNEAMRINDQIEDAKVDRYSVSEQKDNKGRTLSKEQQEYFKDSKVRDENGNLKTYFNGSGDFNVYNANKLSNSSKWGKGIYLTQYEDIAKRYGDKVKEVYLKIDNPINRDNKTISFDEYDSLYQILNEGENGYQEEYDMYDNDLDLLWDMTDGGKWADYAEEIKKTTGKDGIIIKSNDNVEDMAIAFNSNQIKNVDNTNPTSNPDIRKSIGNQGKWNEFLNTQIGEQKGKTVEELKVPIKTQKVEQKSNVNKETRIPTKENFETVKVKTKKTLNPMEISNLTYEDVSTTPNLPIKKQKVGNAESKFYKNVTETSKFINEDVRKELAKEENIKYYDKITNKDTLEKAYQDLQEQGKDGVMEWFTRDDKNADAIDIAKGWILLKQYQDKGDMQGEVEIAKKMRRMGTKAGQAVQTFNIMQRLTPEGMVYYAQKELSEAYDAMVKDKGSKWVKEHSKNFDLTPDEVVFIRDTMKKVSKMENGYDKKVELGKIQKVITDKIPPEKGQGIKAWMRISMLFNPKTQVRNVAGNAVILPINTVGDIVASGVDKLLSKKTGVRTTGMTNAKSYSKGFSKGLYESYNDFKLGINTRDIQGNKFEIGQGKSFKDKGIGKALNRVDGLLSFMLDAGDRGFYEATFVNSLNNQMALNNVTEPTQDMIDIATNEALQRTWQDDNAYTKGVLGIRKFFNGANIKGYGLGDVLIPFAKTPANLTKAIVDYSPVGLTKSLTLEANKIRKAYETKQLTPEMQHKFVQDIGKGFAGSLLYVLGSSLAKAGMLTGESDEDKDVRNFMKNSLGINSYSLKIGDKSFTYDWAQPVASPFAIMANYEKKKEDNPNASTIEKAMTVLGTGFDVVLQQSFLDSLNQVLNGSGTTIENLNKAILDLPARAIPTFSKQIADMVDSTQRVTYEYDKPLQSAINSVKGKIPILNKTLPAKRDTLGNEIKKYGGENNAFNVFFNPANMNKGKLTKEGEEIYNLYKQTGDKSIFPVTAPYYINNKGEKIVFTPQQKEEYQKITGKYTEKSINELLKDNDYKNSSDEKKAEIIKDIISDSQAKAKYDVLKIESEQGKKKRELIDKAGVYPYYDYTLKTKDIEGEEATKKKLEVLEKANYSHESKKALYKEKIGSQDKVYDLIDNININEYLKYKEQNFESDRQDDGTKRGKSISNSKKKKVYNFVNNMKINRNQKLVLLGSQYKLQNDEQRELFKYIDRLPNTKEEKINIFDRFSNNFTVYKDGRISMK